MNLKESNMYFGFKLLKKEKIQEVNSIAYTFEHIKSGAQLLYLENNEENKVFSITFRTPSKNSTGVPHILEHSVLCGSRKFPVKEPFVELIKGSLNTFLNAMTFPDKTMYPVASKNDKDFNNLIDVYLDAVFYPNIYKYPEIMMQEGWHYELKNKEDDIKYKGVVYNEMKGAFSSPESILFRKIQESLFPNTTYGVESGGDPDFIPDLSQKEFLDFHKEYYHPSNSYIFLYGKMDILEKLKFIDENFLNDFEKIHVDSKIKIQESFKEPSYLEVKYPISNNEGDKDKTYLSLNFTVGNALDSELHLAFEILEHILLETPSSPLKKALLESKLGKDVFGIYDNSILQPTFSVIVKNSNKDKINQFKDVVYNCLKNLLKDGIDKKLIESAINLKEFKLREADYQSYPTGLIYNIQCMESWLYDGEPTLHFKYNDILNKIRQNLDNKYFENIIERYLINNTHNSLLIVEPEKGLEEKRVEKIKEKLKKYKDSLSENDIEDLIDKTNKLELRQKQKDSDENLNTIPLLSIDDISKQPEELPLQVRSINEIKTLYHDIFTNKILYVNLYFNTKAVEKEYIQYLPLLSAILGKVSTKDYSYEELSNEININTGGIRYYADTFGKNGEVDNFDSMFVIKGKCLEDKIQELIKLITQVIAKTKFEEKTRIKEIIQELKSRLEMSMFDGGHVVAIKRLVSYLTKLGKYEEMSSGIEFYKFLEELDKNFEDKFDEIVLNLKKVFNKVFNLNNLLISITSEENQYDKFKDNIKILLNDLSKEPLAYYDYNLKLNEKNEGITTSSKVQYVAKGFNFKNCGYEYSGKMLLLKSIINYDYLWNKVRVQGGAYGCFSMFGRNGNMLMVSYRDPNLAETLEVYNNLYKYLDEFNPIDREMTKYIIGTISDLDSPLNPSSKGTRAAENYIRNITFEDRQKERKEVIESSKESIKEFSDLLKEIYKQDYLCVLGNENKVEQNKTNFNNIINLFK